MVYEFCIKQVKKKKDCKTGELLNYIDYYGFLLEIMRKGNKIDKLQINFEALKTLKEVTGKDLTEIEIE
ncbi:hypothetical protein [Helicobacter sp. T3_23-1059]